MSSPQYLPLPPELFAHACDTVTKNVSQLPFLRGGVTVTGELVGVAMECLNAEPTRTLATSTPRDAPAGIASGLDACLEGRLEVSGKTVVPVIAEVLCSAGIATMTEIIDRQMHRPRRALRLLPPWTWHIASTLAPSVRLGGSADGSGVSMSWMDICPVCHTGILNKVVGKQLFGVPRTDFIIECSHCGAKFIPVGPAFRLVSIALIRDPLWKKHLDKTYPPETWASLARTTSLNKPTPHTSTASGKKPAAPLPVASVTLAAMKDGSLAFPLMGKTLFFRPVPLKFTGGVRGDAFARVQKTLGELLEQPAFQHLRSPVDAKYSRYKSLKAGLFLVQLKERNDPFYREFLNPYGDEKYGTLMAGNSGEMEKKGVLIIVMNRGLYHVADSADPVRTTINTKFARIGPDECLLTGDPSRCRVNALLCNNQKEAGMYVHSLENDDERHSVIEGIQALLSPG
jgi:hypothetical protein